MSRFVWFQTLLFATREGQEELATRGRLQVHGLHSFEREKKRETRESAGCRFHHFFFPRYLVDRKRTEKESRRKKKKKKDSKAHALALNRSMTYTAK